MALPKRAPRKRIDKILSNKISNLKLIISKFPELSAFVGRIKNSWTRTQLKEFIANLKIEAQKLLDKGKFNEFNRQILLLENRYTLENPYPESQN